MRNFFANKMCLRIVACLLSVLVLMFFCVLRVTKVASLTYENRSDFNGYKIKIDNGRGDFYYSNGERITGQESFYYLVFLPCDEAILKFSQIARGQELENGLKTLKEQKPVIIKSEKAVSGVGVFSFQGQNRYSNELGLEHIIGYLDADNNGVMGLEKAYNQLLKSESGTEVTFTVSASGEFLLGEKPEMKNSVTSGNVYLTIDKKIQQICYNATKSLKKGAVIVTEINSGKIRGMVSKPSFDPYNLKAYVQSKSSPFLNRALSAYSVGSVFKPLIAAAMLENSKGGYNFTCSGHTDILGIRFYCNNRNGHGNMNLNNAIVHSCNTYFYSAAASVSPKAFTEISATLQFGKKINIADGIYSAAGSFTSLNELKKSKANLANFAIGQGNIALSPLAVSNLYSAIANGGYYYTPTLIEKYTEKDRVTELKSPLKTFVFSEKTANELKKYLVNAVSNGTGKNALPQEGGAGGKTATAQTGRYDNKKEILNAWFCGFFPEKEPKYSVVVLAEDADSGSANSAPIFKKIADEINKII
ncbi:MAG: penicillin-binding protein 2 [Clostridia bacterium]|nr:penicillin-binding protein 2 [Clostridia bacterium]